MYELSEIIAETIAYIDYTKDNNEITKGDLIDSLRMRLCIIMGKIISYPVTTNFALPYITRNVHDIENKTIMDKFFCED